MSHLLVFVKDFLYNFQDAIFILNTSRYILLVEYSAGL